jgi:hypothetical protein
VAPTIAGASLLGAQHVRFVDVRFSATVGIDHSPIFHYGQRARDIQILDSTVYCRTMGTKSGARTAGIGIRGGSTDITIAGDLVHDCTEGLSTAVQDLRSSNISIIHDTFEHFSSDALFLGGLSHVLIKDDVIADIDDPADVVHNDGLLILGNNKDVAIVDDVIENSRSQLILIEPSPIPTATGFVDNAEITVVRCLIFGAGAVAIQDQGGRDVAFVGNTIWDNFYGSLWVLDAFGRKATGTVIEDNIIQGYERYKSAPRIESHNLLYEVLPGHAYGTGDIVNASPRFRNVTGGAFHLDPGSPAIGAGVAYPEAVVKAAGSLDLFGRRVSGRVSLGAFQPTDPAVVYGRSLYVQKGGLPDCVPTLRRICRASG